MIRDLRLIPYRWDVICGVLRMGRNNNSMVYKNQDEKLNLDYV